MSTFEEDQAAYYGSDPDPDPIRANRDQAHEPVRDSVLTWWENKMAQRQARGPDMPARYVTVNPDGSIDRTPIRGEVTYASLHEITLLDQAEWPEGHPCRDCGRLYREHPVTASVLECRDWR